MSAAIYILKRSCINWIKKLKEKPAVIIAIIFFTLVFVVPFLSQGGSNDYARSSDLNILYLIFFGLSLFFLLISIISGLSTGTSFFTMSDVNLMFTSPISSNKILVYGIVKQMGRSVIVSVFMLYQVSNLKHNFGLSSAKSFCVILLYMVLVFLSQLLTLGIYSFTNGNQKRKNIVKYTTIILMLLVIGYIVYGIINRGTVVIQDKVIFLFPVVGWLLGTLVGFLSSNLVLIIVFIAITVLFILSVVVAMIKFKPDYFEDCLINSENTYHAKQALKGDRSAQANIRKKTRYKNVTSMEFKGGMGGSSFFYRHLIEIKRTDRAVFFGLSSLLCLGLGIGIGYISRLVDYAFVIVSFAIACYANVFLAGITKLSQELTRQFIYLVPDSPFKKLVYASISSILRPFVNGILLFLPPVFISGFPLLQSLALIVCFASVNFVFTAANIVMYNIFGKFSRTSIIFFLYFLFVILMLGPGAGVGVVFGLIFDSMALGFFVASIINFAISIGVTFACRNMVHNIEFK